MYVFVTEGFKEVFISRTCFPVAFLYIFDKGLSDGVTGTPSAARRNDVHGRKEPQLLRHKQCCKQ